MVELYPVLLMMMYKRHVADTTVALNKPSTPSTSGRAQKVSRHNQSKSSRLANSTGGRFTTPNSLPFLLQHSSLSNEAALISKESWQA